MATTLIGKYKKRYQSLYDDASSWRTHWKDIADYMIPIKGRYLSGTTGDQHNDGQKKHQKIINGKATDALDILAAGLQGGLTSPSRPWFVLAIDDENLMELESVKFWLHDVRNKMMEIFSRSNFYASIHSIYSELGAFGTSAMLIEEDFDTIIRCRPFTIGEYYLALNAQYKPTTMYRKFAMTAQQMLEKFGEENLSQSVQSALKDDTDLDRYFEVIHCIQPNTNQHKDINPELAFESVYFEEAGAEDKFLRLSGYKTIPFVAPRWKITGVDTYGGSRGMDALGDVKMLQKIEEKKLKGLDKSVDPPMNAPTSMKKQGGTIISGGVNYVDSTTGGQSFTPAYQVRPDLQGAAVEIANIERRIERFFFNDLFLSIINETKSMTATEINKRQGERLLILGPVLERLQSELLDIMIERVYALMEDRDMLPEIPLELENKEIKIEYISILAQAQKEVGTGSLEKLINILGAIVQVNPETVDKVDMDEIIDQYAAMVGVPPKVIRSDDRVAKLRAIRQAEIQKQKQMETAQAAVESGKTLSDTQVGTGSMLDVFGEVAEQTGSVSIPGA